MGSRERVDDLNWGNLKIIQNPDWFCFSLDAVLLAAFASLGPKDRVADLGTGTGVIPLLLHARSPKARIVGLELHEEVVAMAQRSVALNGLEERITIRRGNIRQAASELGKGNFDLVVTNPPYAPIGAGKISCHPIKAAARTEVSCSLEDVIRAGSALLNSEGRFAMVHRPARLGEIISLMRDHRLEPKRLRLVYPAVDKEPNILLIEGIKNGRKDIQVLPPLLVYQSAGLYSAEMKTIFQGEFLRANLSERTFQG